MSPRLPTLTATQVLRLLRRRGFVIARQSGSHILLRHPDGRRTIVPRHGKRDLGRGLLRKILADAELESDDL